MLENSKSSSDAISDLVHRYADAVNHRDSAAWSATFASDASWRLGSEREAKGRVEILSLWTREMQKFRKVVQIVGSGSVDLDRSGRAGSGRWHFQEHFEREDGTSGFMVAHYDDEYLQVDDRWFFATRSLVLHHRRTSEPKAETGPSGPEASVPSTCQNSD